MHAARSTRYTIVSLGQRAATRQAGISGEASAQSVERADSLGEPLKGGGDDGEKLVIGGEGTRQNQSLDLGFATSSSGAYVYLRPQQLGLTSPGDGRSRRHLAQRRRSDVRWHDLMKRVLLAGSLPRGGITERVV